LESLYACKNKIELLNKQDFDGLFNLKILDLSYNQIGFLEEDFFQHMPQIESLNLKSNKIKEFLNYLKNIIYLDLSANSISYFKTSLLNGTSNLYVDLRQNNIELIKNETKDVLNLKSFKIPNIDISDLIDLSYLEELDMSSNSYVNNFELNKAINLKKLVLKNSNIKNTSFLVDLHNLEELDLSDNELDEDFPINILGKINLKVLKLANVGLISARKIELLLDNLEYVDLSANGLIYFESVIINSQI
jgi:Leucine-rich repeat (LRR) protein